MLRNVTRWPLIIAAASLVAGLCPVAAVAQSAPPAAMLSAGGQEASDFVRKKHEDLQAAVKAAKDPKTDPKLLAIFDSMLDYEALSHDSLGDEWAGLSEAQRAEFSGILKQLVQKSYRKNLRDPSDYAVQYLGAEPGPSGTLVKTTAQSKSNKREKALGIDYVVSSTAQGLKVRDVITDEVSLVANYRSQFKRMLKKRGFDGLLEQMRKQLDK